MHGKLHCLGGWDGLGETTDVFDKDIALDFFFVNIIQTIVGDDKGAFLRPIKHVGLLDLISEEKLLSIDQSEEGRVIRESNIVSDLEVVESDL